MRPWRTRFDLTTLLIRDAVALHSTTRQLPTRLGCYTQSSSSSSSSSSVSSYKPTLSRIVCSRDPSRSTTRGGSVEFFTPTSSPPGIGLLVNVVRCGTALIKRSLVFFSCFGACWICHSKSREGFNTIGATVGAVDRSVGATGTTPSFACTATMLSLDGSTTTARGTAVCWLRAQIDLQSTRSKELYRSGSKPIANSMHFTSSWPQLLNSCNFRWNSVWTRGVLWTVFVVVDEPRGTTADVYEGFVGVDAGVGGAHPGQALLFPLLPVKNWSYFLVSLSPVVSLLVRGILCCRRWSHLSAVLSALNASNVIGETVVASLIACSAATLLFLYIQSVGGEVCSTCAFFFWKKKVGYGKPRCEHWRSATAPTILYPTRLAATVLSSTHLATNPHTL